VTYLNLHQGSSGCGTVLRVNTFEIVQYVYLMHASTERSLSLDGRYHSPTDCDPDRITVLACIKYTYHTVSHALSYKNYTVKIQYTADQYAILY